MEDIHRIEDKKRLDEKVKELKQDLGDEGHEQMLDQIRREKEVLAAKQAEEEAEVGTKCSI